MRNKNKTNLNYDSQVYYTKTFFKKNNNKKPNAIYYLSLEKVRYSSIDQKKINTTINKAKEKNKKLTNKTIDNKKETSLQKDKKYSKAYNSLFNTYSNDYKSNYINKNLFEFYNEINETNGMNNIHKKRNNNNNKNFSFKKNDKIKKSFNLSKNKVIKNISYSRNRIKGLKDISLNETESWIKFKNNIFNNNKNESIKEKMIFKKYKNKINNYSLSFVYNNDFKINFANNEIEKNGNGNCNTTKYKNSFIRKEKIKSLYNINNSRIKKSIKIKNKKNDNNVNKDTNDKIISSYTSKGKIKNRYKCNQKLPKSIKVFKNLNISSKPTFFSSYLNSEQNMKSSLISNEYIKQNKIRLNKNQNTGLPLNDNYKLNYTIDSNGKDLQEYESKFLNYELGISDKISTSNYTLDNNNNNNIYNKEDIMNEYEKPVEEIEEIADKIINNSNYRNKTVSMVNNIFINNNNLNRKETFYNDDIEELKKGEKIQKVLNLYVSKNNNNSKS